MAHFRCLFPALLAALFLPCPSAFAEGRAPTRVACVGDSITQGSWVAAGQAYPTQLGRMLGPRWQVVNFGVGGTTMLRMTEHPYWKTQALSEALAFRPHVVIIMLGTNDAYPENWRHSDRFAPDYHDMIRVFAGLPSRPRILCCHPPPVVGGGRYAILEATILEQKPLLEHVAHRAHVELLDMHSPLVGRPDLLPDHIHPNSEGAARLARVAYQALVGKEFEAEVLRHRRGFGQVALPEEGP